MKLRDTVELEHSSAAKAIRGKVCLVTGAGGSIGSELCRQLLALAPAGELAEGTATDARCETAVNEDGLDILEVDCSYVAVGSTRIDLIVASIGGGGLLKMM